MSTSTEWNKPFHVEKNLYMQRKTAVTIIPWESRMALFNFQIRQGINRAFNLGCLLIKSRIFVTIAWSCVGIQSNTHRVILDPPPTSFRVKWPKSRTNVVYSTATATTLATTPSFHWSILIYFDWGKLCTISAWMWYKLIVHTEKN